MRRVMQYRAFLGIAICLVALSMIGVSCCTMTGLTVGATIDMFKPDSLYGPGWKIKAVKPGKRIKVILNNGEEVVGKYMGIQRIPEEEYAKRYDSFREEQRSKIPIPKLNDKITVTQKSGNQRRCQLLGFDYHYLPAKLNREKDTTSVLSSHIASVRLSGDTTVSLVYLRHVDKIFSSDSNVIEGEALRRSASAGEIPFMSAITIQQQTGIISVAMDRVHEIQTRNKKYAAWIGAGFGFAIEATLSILYLATK
jgi:hypothetical protein